MSGTPHVPASDEVAWLRARVAELEELTARLREAAAARDELAAAQLAARDAQIAALAAQVEELRRRQDKDSSTSSRPPSSDSPYTKKPRDRSLRGRSGRRPGKQPGAQSSTLKQSPDPDETVLCGPAACGCCGHDLTGEPVLGTVQKRQVFEASPPPPPAVTEYQVAARQCPDCGEISVGLAPAGVTGRVQYGPGVHAKAALAVCAHYLPVARAARLVAALTGVNVSAGFVAGVRGKAARLLAPFMDRVRELLPAAPVLYADETPARAAGNLRYVHVACTEFLTAMHTGDRTSQAIDAGRILPGYAGTIVRDGYKGYEHLTDALHAWCGAQYAEPGIMRNGAARGGRVACRGGARADPGAGMFCIITGSRGRRGRGRTGDTVRALCWAGSSARVPVLSAEGLRGGRSGLFANPRGPAIVRWWPGQPRCAAGSSRRCGEGYERRFSWQRVRGSPLLPSARA